MLLQVVAASAARWNDLVELFERTGPRGGQPVTNACWCMFWRLERSEFSRNAQWTNPELRGHANRAALEDLVRADRMPGMLAYADGRAVGWCAIAPREEFVRLESSRPLARVDDAPVWSVVCFYIERQYQRRGIGVALLEGALEYARARGATIVEGYPSKPGDADPFTGLEAMFEEAGFTQVRSGKRRSVWRYVL